MQCGGEGIRQECDKVTVCFATALITSSPALLLIVYPPLDYNQAANCNFTFFICTLSCSFVFTLSNTSPVFLVYFRKLWVDNGFVNPLQSERAETVWVTVKVNLAKYNLNGN